MIHLRGCATQLEMFDALSPKDRQTADDQAVLQFVPAWRYELAQAGVPPRKRASRDPNCRGAGAGGSRQT